MCFALPRVREMWKVNGFPNVRTRLDVRSSKFQDSLFIICINYTQSSAIMIHFSTTQTSSGVRCCLIVRMQWMVMHCSVWQAGRPAPIKLLRATLLVRVDYAKWHYENGPCLISRLKQSLTLTLLHRIHGFRIFGDHFGNSIDNGSSSSSWRSVRNICFIAGIIQAHTRSDGGALCTPGTLAGPGRFRFRFFWMMCMFLFGML